MILGEDDLAQEQLYLRARDHLGVRALHGYGTVSGLDVSWNAAEGQVEVSPGLAVDPVGRLVCVPADQCADLAGWLSDHRAAVRQAMAAASLPATVSLYVVLCYRECETDTVPVPSESCRTADESMAASRVQDSFELRMLLAPPVEGGEVAGPGLATVIDRILSVLESQLGGSVLDTDEVRRGLVAWVTRLRPELPGAACLPAPDDNCGQRPEAPSTGVVLARVDLELDEDAGGGLALGSAPEVLQDERPVLLSTRFLQEWFTELMLRPELWRRVEDHNALLNLEVGDVHQQYLPVDGSRPLEGDLDAGGNALTRLAASTQPHHAVRADQVFGGDLAPTAGAARIEALQGFPVAASGTNAPSAGELLRFDGASWVPTPPAEVRLGPVLPLVTIEPMGRLTRPDAVSPGVFLLWFHLDVPGNSVVLPDLAYGEQFVILEELCPGGEPSLQQVASNLVDVSPVGCNTFRVEVRRAEAELLRFLFLLKGMSVRFAGDPADHPLVGYTEDRGIVWLGQDDGPATVTAFVVNPSGTKTIAGFEDVTSVPVLPGGKLFTIGGS
jgi:hypothetical protein